MNYQIFEFVCPKSKYFKDKCLKFGKITKYEVDC